MFEKLAGSMLREFGVQVPQAKRKTDILEVGVESFGQSILAYRKLPTLEDEEVEALQIFSSLWGKVEDKYWGILEVGFTYDPEKVNQKQITELEDFHKKIKLQYFLGKAVRDALAFRKGGFLEIVFPDKKGAEYPVFQNENNERTIPNELKGNGFRIEYIDPKTIKDIVKETNREKENYGFVKYYKQKAGNETTAINIHPDRVLHIDLPGKGSLAERLYRVIRSLENIFTACGTIVHRKGNPFLDVTLQVWDDKLVERTRKELQELNASHEFIHDNRATLNVPEIGGRALNPEPYAEIEIKGLSAGSGIPKTLLFGSGEGTISTSDINMKDWFRTAEAFQNFMTEFINYLDTLYWEMVHGEKLEFPIIWNDLYPADEKRTSEIRKNHAETDMKYYEQGIPIETINEDRKDYGLNELIFEEVVEEEFEKVTEMARRTFVTPAEFRNFLAHLLRQYKLKIEQEARPLFDEV